MSCYIKLGLLAFYAKLEALRQSRAAHSSLPPEENEAFNSEVY